MPQRLFYLPCLIVTLILLTACETISDSYRSFLGGEDNTEPPSPLTEINTRADISELWDTDVGSGTDEQYLKLIPVHADNRIFVADAGGDITALDSNSGSTLWEKDIDVNITGGPGAGAGVIVVGTSDGELVALSQETGEVAWRGRVSSEVLSTPQIAGGFVVARSIDGKIAGLDAATGERVWIYDRSVPALTLRGTSTPVIADNLVLAGFDGGRLAAIELDTGKLVWETRVALGSGRTELERMVDIDADPVVRDDVIYVATFQGRVAAISLLSGEIQWTRDISSHAGLSVDETRLYITDDNSFIWALDRFSGSSIWRQEKLRARAITAPANIGSLVVVADLEGYLHWLDKDTGDFVARSRISEGRVLAAPLSVNGVVYGYANDGTLSAQTYDNLSERVAAETETVPEAGSGEEESEAEAPEVAAESAVQEEDDSWSFWDLFSSEDELDDDLAD